MSSLLAVESTITSFQALHDRLGLRRAEAVSFFSEWQNLDGQCLASELSERDRTLLDHLQQRYYHYYNAGLLTEGTVLLSIIAPLLEQLRFHEPPFFVRSEAPVRLEVEERDEVYRGRMDVLVICDHLWVLTVEAKRSKFAVDIALPQCLAYMKEAPQKSSFGMVTNGSDFIFCKLEDERYDFSDSFSLLSRHNKLYEVAAILSRFKQLIQSKK